MTSLWVVDWNGSKLSVLPARNAKCARDHAHARLGAEDDGWPTRNTSRIRGVLPVGALELEVGPRELCNEPRKGRLWVGEVEIRWSGPHSGRHPRTPSEEPSRQLPGAFTRIEPTRLWSFTWSDQALVLFNARDSAAALRWAKRSGYGRPKQANPDSVEPIDRIEVQLAPDENGWSPVCYRVWIGSYKVGWPPTQDQEPAPENPGPIAEEARLPIPRYSIVRAHGRRRDPRRTASV